MQPGGGSLRVGRVGESGIENARIAGTGTSLGSG